jgi:DNA-binding MurR/RpiR family transcriptional regulator
MIENHSSLDPQLTPSEQKLFLMFSEHINRHEDVSIPALANAAELPTRTVSRLMQSIAKKGYLEFGLTATGRAVARASIAALQRFFPN